MPALTSKQQAFARCVGVRNMSLIDAYRAAGYSYKNQTTKCQQANASKLHKNTAIRLAIDSYNREADRSMIASVASDEELVLTELRRVIKEGDNDNVRVRAAEALGKTVPGLFKGEERTDPQRTVAEIQAELDELLAERGMKLVKSDKPDKSIH